MTNLGMLFCKMVVGSLYYCDYYCDLIFLFTMQVFGYDGAFLRQIGGEGVTNYPIGVGIDSAGRILVADNHNNFNATLFTPDGRLVTALESRVKHAQCFDVALADDGSVVLASKDFRVYIYRYAVATPSVTDERAPTAVVRENPSKLDMLSW
jgi:NHL repeat